MSIVIPLWGLGMYFGFEIYLDSGVNWKYLSISEALQNKARELKAALELKQRSSHPCILLWHLSG